MASSTSEAQIKNEIARLTASIDLYKSSHVSTRHPQAHTRSNTYVNPNYKPTNKHVRPATTINHPLVPQTRPTPPPTQLKEVVLGGVAFESSARSLVRKDLPKPVSSSLAKPSAPRPTAPHQHFSRKAGHLNPNTRTYKRKASRGRHGASLARNMTLNNNRRPYQARRLSSKRLKYSDKPCPPFTTTGACSRGLTCMYRHDPSKIAICWNFLQGGCPNSADSCNLSHDPTPERTPLCLHFLNKGRCTRDNCPFPHVNVGTRQGVCRDFAVLGYCEKGLDCDKQHVRECPDFAEKGTCSTRGCKLPHVIRANRNRKPTATTTRMTTAYGSVVIAPSNADSGISTGTDDSSLQQVTAENAQLGDEYISLTFNESESSEDESGDEDMEEGEEEEGEDSDSPHDTEEMVEE